MPRNEPWDSESARAAALLSAEARKRRAEMNPLDRALESLKAESPALVKELLKAAMGKDEFSDLKVEVRLRAIERALEYGLGKPRVTRDDPGPEEEAPPTADDLFT